MIKDPLKDILEKFCQEEFLDGNRAELDIETAKIDLDNNLAQFYSYDIERKHHIMGQSETISYMINTLFTILSHIVKNSTKKITD